MIPKLIHYCWFGKNEKPSSVKQCIETWKRFLPDYQLMEWNENTFQIDYCAYSKQAYESKKYAFVSDVARLYALSQYGGIYFDTDIEVLKSLDSYLSSNMILAFESTSVLMTGFFATSPFNPIIDELLRDYKKRKFVNIDGSYNITPNTRYLTDCMRKYGLVVNGRAQKLENNVQVFEIDVFGGFDADNSMYDISESTILVHRCNASWMGTKNRIMFNMKRYFAKKLGKERCMALRSYLKK